jgi:hypothetical protein
LESGVSANIVEPFSESMPSGFARVIMPSKNLKRDDDGSPEMIML